MNALNTLFTLLASWVPASIRNAIGPDKVAHLIAGAFFGIIAAVIAGFLSAGAVWALVAGAAVGLAKEVLDLIKNKKAAAAGKKPPHTVDFWDLVWTAAGGLLVMLAAILIFGMPTGLPEGVAATVAS